jgi:hypothetical protein
MSGSVVAPATHTGPAASPSGAQSGFSAAFWVSTALSLVLLVAGASSVPWWWKFTPWSAQAASAPTPPDGVTGFSGGCDAFQVFAQNRWDPVGAAVRAQPNVLSKKVGSYSPNASIAINGWVHSRAAYPTNTAPWNSDAWFHLADESGWVSFGAVRATPTGYDPTGLSARGGSPVATSGACQGSVR